RRGDRRARHALATRPSSDLPPRGAHSCDWRPESRTSDVRNATLFVIVRSWAVGRASEPLQEHAHLLRSLLIPAPLRDLDAAAMEIGRAHLNSSHVKISYAVF